MAETAAMSGTAAARTANMLYDGDFIDLTSESEPQPQNADEDDVVMVNEVSRSQTETAVKSPVNANKKKLQSPNTKEATVILSSVKNSQQIRFPVKLTTNVNGTHILVEQSVGREIGQLLSHNKSEKNRVMATIASTKTIPSQPGGRSPGKLSILQKATYKVSKNVEGKCDEKSPFKAAVVKKVGVKTNINPVAMQRYRAIKPAPLSSKVSSNRSNNIDVEDLILLPTSSETGLEATNQPNYDNVNLVPSQSESPSKPQVAKKSFTTSPKLQGVLLGSPENFQNLKLSSNNNDDDVIVISDDTKKEETVKPKEMQIGSPGNKVNKIQQKNILVQNKDSEKGYAFSAPQPLLPNLQAKGVTPPRCPNVNVQNVKIVRPSLSPLKKPSPLVSLKEPPAKAHAKTLQSVKDSTGQELDIVEHQVAPNSQNFASQVPVQAFAGHLNGQEVYFLMYPAQTDGGAVKAVQVADVENCTVIPDDDDIELGEPTVESVLEEVIETEKDDPLQHLVETAPIESSCLVTPVDIAEILKQGKMAAKAELMRDRCDCVVLKNMKLYQRGFTKREMRKAYCVKYLHTYIKKEEVKIRQLKSSYLDKSNFVHCGKTFKNFLPETSQCDEGDPDEYVIEYNDIERRLNEEIYNTQTLPVITNVISRVNEEVLQMKTQHARGSEDLQTKLAKPEAALKLIKRGLELIKSWSQETQSDKEKADKSLPIPPRKKMIAVEPKKKRNSAPIEVVVESPKKVGRARKNEVSPKKEEPKVRTVGRKRVQTEKAQAISKEKVTKASTGEKGGKASNVATVKEVRKRKTEAPVEVKSPVKRGRRPKNRVDYGSVDDDNELFVIKKVDILKGRRRK